MVGSAFEINEAEAIARRRLTVCDVAEIIEHWQALRSVSAFPRALEYAELLFVSVCMFSRDKRYCCGDSTQRQGWEAFQKEN